MMALTNRSMLPMLAPRYALIKLRIQHHHPLTMFRDSFDVNFGYTSMVALYTSNFTLFSAVGLSRGVVRR